MKTMSIQFTARGKAEFKETELDENLAANEILLKTEVTLISPGTEFACLNGVTNRGNEIQFPMTLGYSAVGRVLKVGENVKGFAEGDRCLCYHSVHRNYQKRPVADVVKIEDDGLDAKYAVFCVVGCMGFQGVRRCRVEIGESAMVMGLGLLGQFAIQTAALSGCYPVIGIDYNAKRREIALQSGADAVFSPDEENLEEKIKELTSGRKCDSVIEVTGNPQAVVQGLKLTAEHGRISLVGCSRTPTENIDFYNLVHRPGISILGAHNMARPMHDRRPGVWTMNEDMSVLLRYMAAGKLTAEPMFTMTADPKQAPEIYTRIFNRDPDMLGVVFDWSNY